MDKNELWKLYCQRDKEFEKAKGRRTLITIIGFAIFYFTALYSFGKPTDLKDFGAMLMVSLVFGGLHFWINAPIFVYLCNKGREESEVLKHIKKRMDEAE